MSSASARALAARKVLVVGTDTGVGKTWVGCALARALVEVGRSVVAVKPAETGCGEEPAAHEDGALLAAATGQRTPRAALLRLRDPVAPAEAAEREGRPIDFAALCAAASAAVLGVDVALIEGAGGVLSPITWEHHALDLGRALEAGVLLVAADRLGTQSLTLTALRAVEAEGLPVLGVVLTAPAEADSSTGSNGAALRRLRPGLAVHEAPRVVGAAAVAALRPVLGWL